MAVKNMVKVGIPGEKDELAWEIRDELSASGNGNTILVPDGIDGIAISVEPTTAQAKFQYTMSTLAEVLSGNAVWYDSDTGLSSVNYNDVIFPCTAIRLVQSGAGSSILNARAQ
jgi:hypothetical protein